MASNLMASDLLDIDWGERARNILANAGQSGRRPERVPEIRVPVRAEPVEVRERNAVTDPGSWLNRGLRNLVGNAADVILGRESGNSLVDLGAANIPGVGAGAILAAGGMPGLLDIAGAGDIKTILKGLKHGGKIGENTARFILRNYDEDALRAVDEYVGRFPKVGNIQVPDAYKILSEGRSGEVYLPKEMPEHLQPAALATRELPNIDWEGRKKYALERVIDSGVDEKEAAESVSRIVAEEKSAYDESLAHIREAAENGDFIGAIGASQAIRELMNSGNGEEVSALLKTINENGIAGSYWLTDYINRLKSAAQQNRTPLLVSEGNTSKEAVDFVNAYNDYTLMQYGKAQPLEDIEARQFRSEANKASKAAAKEARKAQANPTASTVLKAAVADADAEQTKHAVDMAKIEADRARYMRNLEKRAEENRATTQSQQAAADTRRAAEEASRPVMAETAPEARATTWRDTWNSGDHKVDYEGILGRRNLTEDEKRDAFVLDSLASYWANRLRETRPVNGEWPGTASYRHNNLNYGMVPGKVGVGDEFIKDVRHNVNIGNMPGVSFSLQRPSMVVNPSARSIVVDGYDIYYPLFHRKIDEKAKSIDARYYYDPFDENYQILSHPVNSQ